MTWKLCMALPTLPHGAMPRLRPAGSFSGTSRFSCSPLRPLWKGQAVSDRPGRAGKDSQVWLGSKGQSVSMKGRGQCGPLHHVQGIFTQTICSHSTSANPGLCPPYQAT